MRNCFITPIPEYEIAASLLDRAADAILSKDDDLAKMCLVQSNIPALCEFTDRIIRRIDEGIHWQSSMPKDTIPKAERVVTRMPSLRVQQSIFNRDGWRCRFCGVRVISRRARSKLWQLYPEETKRTEDSVGQHCALGSLSASLDHILPHARGGNNQEDNLVTACTACQFGRNQWTLAEVGFSDPREREPILDDWDGLERLL